LERSIRHRSQAGVWLVINVNSNVAGLGGGDIKRGTGGGDMRKVGKPDTCEGARSEGWWKKC